MGAECHMEEANEHFVQCPSSGISLKAAPSQREMWKWSPLAACCRPPRQGSMQSCLFRETKRGHFFCLLLMS